MLSYAPAGDRNAVFLSLVKVYADFENVRLLSSRTVYFYESPVGTYTELMNKRKEDLMSPVVLRPGYSHH